MLMTKQKITFLTVIAKSSCGSHRPEIYSECGFSTCPLLHGPDHRGCPQANPVCFMIFTPPVASPAVSVVTTISWCAYQREVPIIMAGNGERLILSYPGSSSFHLQDCDQRVE